MEEKVPEVVKSVGTSVVSSAWDFASKNPKLSAGVAVVSTALLGTVGYFAYKTRLFEKVGFKITKEGFESAPKETSQEAGDVDAREDIKGKQDSADSTKQKIGHIKSQDGGVDFSQTMGFGKK